MNLPELRAHECERCRARRECIVEGQGGRKPASRKKGVSEDMTWLKDTRWLWNQWREVRVCTRSPSLRTRAPYAIGMLAASSSGDDGGGCTLACAQVIFRADGSFLAPAENCERAGNPKCKWSADDDRVFVTCALVTRHTPNSSCPPHGSTWFGHVRARRFGDAGLHTLSATPDQQMLNGHRDSDGDSVSAQRVA